ncbi:MAG: DNA mismatch repair protein MutS, partial [Alphaproteobacteria bacterium]|nr:DNA mismatch repair protein MutS [Alphaproteobacteria bacterium]
MMAQYLEIKAANPGSLLFYRMGDFYELFFTDAEIAAQALGITLTKRGQHLGADIAMCGVPAHSHTRYLRKLVALGHRVAVCEQLEVPSEAKKRGPKAVVKRDVVRLVTAGTLTEDDLLESGAPNHLLALAMLRHDGTEFGLAAGDISTGILQVKTISARGLTDEISRIAPAEIIVSRHTLDVLADHKIVPATLGAQLAVQPTELFATATATKRIGEVMDGERFDPSMLSRVGRSALAALV